MMLDAIESKIDQMKMWDCGMRRIPISQCHQLLQQGRIQPLQFRELSYFYFDCFLHVVPVCYTPIQKVSFHGVASRLSDLIMGEIETRQIQNWKFLKKY